MFNTEQLQPLITCSSYMDDGLSRTKTTILNATRGGLHGRIKTGFSWPDASSSHQGLG